MSGVTVRLASVADSEVIAAMLGRHAAEIGDEAVFHSTAEKVRNFGFGDQALFSTFIAERNGEPQGFVLFFPTFSTTRGEPGLYVQDIWVDPAIRGEGVGRRLLAVCGEHARQRWGATHMLLLVYDDNPNALAFYRRLGFVQDERDRPLHVDGRWFAGLIGDEGGTAS